MTTESWTNLNAFAARLTAAGIQDFSLYAIWSMRETLETENGAETLEDYCLRRQRGSSSQEGNFTIVSKSGQHTRSRAIPPWEARFGVERAASVRRDGRCGRRCLILSHGEAMLMRQLKFLLQMQSQRWMLLSIDLRFDIY